MSEVTIVIPNYNGMNYLRTCLPSLEKQTIEGIKILIVDNGSTDGSIEWLAEEYQDVQVLALDQNYGFCVAVNKGIQASETPFVILLNNDTEVEPEFTEALLEAIKQSKNIFSCQAKMLDYKERQLIDDAGDFYCALGWAFARGKGQPEELYQRKDLIFASCAGAAIYRKEVLEQIGYFDEKHFAYLEDIDIGYRARIYGYVNYFVPKARVYHMGSATTGSRYNDMKVRLAARNSLYLAYKNMPLGQLILNSPLILTGILIKHIFFSRKKLGKAYREGISQGIKLCNRESKVPYSGENFRNYVGIQLDLWKNLIRRLRKI